MSTLAIVSVIYVVIGFIFGVVAALYNDQISSDPDIVLLLLATMVLWPLEVLYGIFQCLNGKSR